MSFEGYAGEGTDEAVPVPSPIENAVTRRPPRAFRTQVGTTLVAQVGRLALAVLQGAIIARWLGPQGKGVLAVALLVPAMLQLALGLGIGPSMTFHLAASRIDLRTLTRHASGFALIGGALSAAVTAIAWATGLLGAILPGIPPAAVAVGVAGITVAMLTTFLSALLQGLHRIASVNLLTLAGGAVMLVLTAFAVVVLGAGPLAIVVMSLIAGAIGLIAALVAFRRDRISLRPLISVVTVKPLLSYGLRAYAGNLLQFFNYRLDVFVLNFIAGPAAVGVYTVSVRLAELVWQVPNAASFVLFPRAAARPAREMNRFTPRVLRWTVVITVLAAAALLAVSPIGIRLVYGPAFERAFVPMALLLPGVVALGAGKVLTTDIAGRGYPHYNAIVSGLCLVLTIVLDVLLIPAHGASGAAVASSVAYVAVTALAAGFWLTVRRRDGVPVRPSV